VAEKSEANNTQGKKNKTNEDRKENEHGCTGELGTEVS
jgi:hypothetical protein